jgi:predicted nucleotidyltransferase
MIDIGLDDNALKLMRSVFVQFPDVCRVVLFGSRAKGIAGNSSDVDLAVDGISDELEIERMTMELEDLPLPYQFDVKALNCIENPALREHIERVGITIYTID